MTTATEPHVFQDDDHDSQVASRECAGPHPCKVRPLERPVFHPGQLLTAEALRLGQHYVEQRLGLRRFVDGVGVVCGLGVRCYEGEPGHLMIDPGYAIDCCGNDLVVDGPLCVDICGSIAGDRPSLKPCNGDDATVATKSEDEQARYVVRLESVPVGKAPVPVVVGRGDGERRSECLDSQEILGVRVCVEPARKAGVDAGERNRVKRFRVVADEVVCGVGKQLQEASSRVGVEDQSADDAVGVALADALLLSIRDQPPTTLCSLPDVIREQRDVLKQRIAKDSDEPSDDKTDGPSDADVEAAKTTLARALAGLIDDRRQAYLAQKCEECCPRTGVAVAELLVDWRGRDCGPDSCRLVAIDAQPPAREELHPRSSWWRGDEVALYDAYFRGVREACVMLTARGITVAPREVPAGPLEGERELGDLPGKCIDDEAATQLDRTFFPWLKQYGAHAELRRLALYRNSAVYAPCGAGVVLWTVCGRVVSIEITDLGHDVPWYVGASARSFSDYVRYTSGLEEWWGRLYLPPAPRTEPDPLDEAIDGIGPKTEAALFRGGLWTLEQLVAVPYEIINDLVSPVLMHFPPEEFARWVEEARGRLGPGGDAQKLRDEYGRQAKARFERAPEEEQ